MDRAHYYKKYIWDAINRVCIFILAGTPFGLILLEDANLARGIALMVCALLLLVVSIFVSADLLEKEDRIKARKKS